jgi:hypothetical protein
VEWNPLNWGTSGTTAAVAIVSAVISLLALGANLWSAKAASRSADSSEEAAKSAEESVSIQREQWSEGKEARLYAKFWHDWEALKRTPLKAGESQFTLAVRNEGRSPAFDLGASSNTPISKTGVSTSALSRLNPHEETNLNFRFPDPFVAEEVFFWKVSISYRDGHGAHKFVIVHRLENDTRPNSATSVNSILVASALLDGKPHFQHPSNAGEGRLALPLDVESR